MSNIERLKNVSDAEGKLSESEMLRYSKISNKTRKLQYLLAHSIVKDVCGENVITDEKGVPTIKSGFISIAHKDAWVVVAVSDVRVGIDIENTDIIRDFSKQSELLNLPKTDDRQTFYKNFVCFESKFKFGDGANKTNMYFYTKDNYLLGICTSAQPKDIKFVLSDAGRVSFLCAE